MNVLFQNCTSIPFEFGAAVVMLVCAVVTGRVASWGMPVLKGSYILDVFAWQLLCLVTSVMTAWSVVRVIYLIAFR
jgi:hypothetical protein